MVEELHGNEAPPRVFVSYSHDTSEHKGWVLKLAHRLICNGVDVTLDQYQLQLGQDLLGFMEQGLGVADRVLAICSDNYVDKANGMQGGVGYERMILTAEIMRNLRDDRVIPIVRNNCSKTMLPLFLSNKLYVDFRKDDLFESRYEELLRTIHRQPLVVRPPLGTNPYRGELANPVRFATQIERYASPAAEGSASFNYENNNGEFVLGSGDLEFDTVWSTGGHGSIHAYNDGSNIDSLALAPRVGSFNLLGDVSSLDGSSRSRLARVGDVVVFKNVNGYFAAVRVDKVDTRDTGALGEPILEIGYKIQTNRSSRFD